MKHSDFYIGLEFVGIAGFHWRCTDVGTRTILAIRLDRDSPEWYQGPPYIAKEVVFDEKEIGRCYFTNAEAITAALQDHKNSPRLSYPAEVLRRMMEAQHAHRYPHEGVLRFDHLRSDGEILHPYAGRKKGDIWIVDLYLPFLDIYDGMAEHEFIALPRATDQDIRGRQDSSS